MTALIDKDIKVVISTVFHVFKNLKENLRMLCRDMEHFFKKTYTELLDKESRMSLMKITLDDTNSRLDF